MRVIHSNPNANVYFRAKQTRLNLFMTVVQ
jgi:hypothetical protein